MAAEAVDGEDDEVVDGVHVKEEVIFAQKVAHGHGACEYVDDWVVVNCGGTRLEEDVNGHVNVTRARDENEEMSCKGVQWKVGEL